MKEKEEEIKKKSIEADLAIAVTVKETNNLPSPTANIATVEADFESRPSQSHIDATSSETLLVEDDQRN